MEEILYKAHELGVFDEFMEEVKKVRNDNKFKNRYEIYEIALENILKKKYDEGVDFKEK